MIIISSISSISLEYFIYIYIYIEREGGGERNRIKEI